MRDEPGAAVPLPDHTTPNAAPGIDGNTSRLRLAGWHRHLAALWAAQLISALAFSFALPFLPLYIQSLGIADPGEAALWAGASSAAFSIVMAAFGPVWGSLADRHGPRLMVGRAMFGGAIVIGSMGLARQVYDLFALRIVQGGITGVQAAITVLVTTLVPRERMGWSVGVLQMATFAGASIGPLVGGLTADQFGYRTAFLITGLLMVLSGAVVFTNIPEIKTINRPGARVGAFQGLHWAAASPAIVSMVLILFLLQFASTVISPVLPLFIKELAADPERVASTAGMVLGLGGLFGALSAMGAGRIADRFGHRRVVIAASLGSALLYAPQALVTTTEQLLALRIGLGLFTGALIPSTLAIVGLATPPERRGLAFGVAASASSLGSAAGPLVGAAVAASLGIRAVFLVTAVALLLATAFVARTPSGTTDDAQSQ
jgi:MFS transporter, DHA1 family, multidrug resistance protein